MVQGLPFSREAMNHTKFLAQRHCDSEVDSIQIPWHQCPRQPERLGCFCQSKVWFSFRLELLGDDRPRHTKKDPTVLFDAKNALTWTQCKLQCLAMSRPRQSSTPLSPCPMPTSLTQLYLALSFQLALVIDCTSLLTQGTPIKTIQISNWEEAS